MDLRRRIVLSAGSVITLVGVILFIVGLANDDNTLRGIAGLVSAVGMIINSVILYRIMWTASIPGRADISNERSE